MEGPASEALRGDGAKRKSVRKRLPIRGSRCGTIGRICRSAGVLRGVLPLRSAVHCCRCEALDLTEREQTHKKEDDHCGHPHTEKISWISAIWLRGCQGSRPGLADPESWLGRNRLECDIDAYAVAHALAVIDIGAGKAGQVAVIGRSVLGYLVVEGLHPRGVESELLAYLV